MCMFLDSWRKTGELEGDTCRMGKHMSTWPRIERTTFWLIDKENQNQVKHKWPASHIIASIASRIASHSTVVIFTLANVYISITKMFQMSYISDYSGSVNVLMWGKEEELSLASFCLIYWSWGWTAALKKKTAIMTERTESQTRESERNCYCSKYIENKAKTRKAQRVLSP